MFTIKTCLTWLLCYKDLNVYSRLLCCFVPPTPPRSPISLNYNIVVNLMHADTGDLLPQISSYLRYLFASLWLDGLRFQQQLSIQMLAVQTYRTPMLVVLAALLSLPSRWKSTSIYIHVLSAHFNELVIAGFGLCRLKTFNLLNSLKSEYFTQDLKKNNNNNLKITN